MTGHCGKCWLSHHDWWQGGYSDKTSRHTCTLILNSTGASQCGIPPLSHTFHLHRWVTAGEEKRGARTESHQERGGAVWKRRWRDQRKGVDGFPVWINEEEGSCLINELSVCCAPSYTSAGSTSHNTNITWMLFSQLKEPLVYQIFYAFRDNSKQIHTKESLRPRVVRGSINCRRYLNLFCKHFLRLKKKGLHFFTESAYFKSKFTQATICTAASRLFDLNNNSRLNLYLKPPSLSECRPLFWLKHSSCSRLCLFTFFFLDLLIFFG